MNPVASEHVGSSLSKDRGTHTRKETTLLLAFSMTDVHEYKPGIETDDGQPIAVQNMLNVFISYTRQKNNGAR